MKINRLLTNAGWIVLCKGAQSLIQLAVGMLSARYLGPSGYGLVHYAASIVSFAIPVMQLGMMDTLVQEYVDRPEQESQVFGTAFVMNLLSAMACVIGVTAFAAVANGGEKTTIVVCALYSTGLIFRSAEMMQRWFEAKLLSKYASIGMLCAHVVVSVYKVCLLIGGKDVRWFALSHTVEYAVMSVLLLAAYRKKSGRGLAFSAAMARKLFARSRHYILPSILAVTCVSSASIIMKLMVGETENGYFSAAVTCTAVVQFVYYALIDSARPVILAGKQQDEAQFRRSISGLYCIIVYAALAQSAVFTLFSKSIIRFLFGGDYLPAVPVLQILIWQIAFSYMGAVRNIWILAEGKDTRLLTIQFWGAVINISLNLLLIPRCGACGAAAASLMTQIMMNFVLGFFLKDIRPNNWLLLAGLAPGSVGQNIRNLLKEHSLERAL